MSNGAGSGSREKNTGLPSPSLPEEPGASSLSMTGFWGGSYLTVAHTSAATLSERNSTQHKPSTLPLRAFHSPTLLVVKLETMICICNLPKSNVNWNLYPFPGQKQDLRVWLFYLYSPKVPVFLNPHPRICLLILERKRGRERETSMWKRNIDLLLPIHDPTRDWTHNLRMCPDWKWNPQIFGVQDNTLPNWDTQPSNFFIYFNSTLILNPIMQNYHFYTIKTHLHLIIYLPCFFTIHSFLYPYSSIWTPFTSTWRMPLAFPLV